jgi:DNA sulfur modification protein DndB
LGNHFFANSNKSFEKVLRKLNDVNWRRDCDDWAMRTIRANGRMINNEEAITLTCNVLKRHLNIPLDEFEQTKETAFLDRK